ncbi:lysylphosphatidylglycerol synthase transmembrane domain-containing protein [Nocardioides dilutus]
MTVTWWRWLRLLAGVAILGALAVRLGSEPVLAGLRATSVPALVVALVVTAGTTWCCARRWRLVAACLGDRLPEGAAYRSYYRSQLVNATLPLGVVGDVDRGIRHGLRAVVWERGLGQLAQAALTIALLVLLPSAAGWTAGVVAAAAIAGVLVVLLLARRQVRHLRSPGLLARVALLSVVASAGHLLVFVVATRAAGVAVPLLELLPLGALVLVASSVPIGVAGWGPREGVAAWAFAAVGLGADTGLTVAVTYGVMSLVATLPGLLVVLRPARTAVAHG